jgi:hypothetical protein
MQRMFVGADLHPNMKESETLPVPNPKKNSDSDLDTDSYPENIVPVVHDN